MSDLRNYLDLIKKSKDLKIIKKPVSSKYEIAGITAKVDGSYAVLFKNVKNSKFRLVSNLVGTRKRFGQAVGGDENSIHNKVISAIKKSKKPKISTTGKFLENQSNDLSILPIEGHFVRVSLFFSIEFAMSISSFPQSAWYAPAIDIAGWTPTVIDTLISSPCSLASIKHRWRCRPSTILIEKWVLSIGINL